MTLGIACPARALLVLFLAVPAAAQVDYKLAFEPGDTHWNVEARFPVHGEPTLDYWFQLWTPGAYHVALFARFAEDVKATDDQGRELTVETPEESLYRVKLTPDVKEVVLRYRMRSASDGTLSNDVIDVEANRIRDAYAYVNPPSVFGFVPSHIGEKVAVELDLPDGWKCATVLEQDERGRYVAPSYLRFEDSPFLFAPELVEEHFDVDGKPHTLTVYGKSADEAQAIAAGCQKIVAAASSLMQGLPYDRYEFLMAFVPEASGSGLEHSFSTLILLSEQVEPEANEFWNIVAHEFYHLWCAERIHVQGIQTPDFTQPFQTGTIWVNEGVTEYMTRHVLLHAGFQDQAELLTALVGPMKAPPLGSWTQVSRDFGADDEGFMKVAMPFMFKMYGLGPRVILALDLEMRRASGGERGVVDFTRALMKEYFEKDKGFGEEELPDILTRVAGADMSAFYDKYIDGKEVPDPSKSLDVIGWSFENGKAAPLPAPSEAQQRAARDFFSASGQP